MPDWSKINPLAAIKAALIGGAIGAVAGGGLFAAKSVLGKIPPASSDLRTPTVNLDIAAPDLIPGLILLEEMSSLFSDNSTKQLWQSTTDALIRNLDQFYNVVVLLDQRKKKKSEVPSVNLQNPIIASSVKMQALGQRASSILTELGLILKQNNIDKEKFDSINMDITNTLNSTWLNTRDLTS